MEANQSLVTAIRALFSLLALLAVVDFARYRDAARRDIMFMFLSVALSNLAPATTDLFGIPASVASSASIVLLLLQPLLVMRMAAYFRPYSRWWNAGTAAAYLLSIVTLILIGKNVRVVPLIFVGLYFVGAELVAAITFISGARASGGVTRRRLTLAAAGTFALGLLIVAAIVLTVAKAPTGAVTAVAYSLSFVVIASYYLAFSTPRWLRRTWQYAEVIRLFDDVSALPADGQISAIERLLAVTVLRVVGNGVVAGVATMDGGQAGELELHALDKQGREERLRVDVSDVPKLSNESAGTTRLSGGSSEEIGAALLAVARERRAEFVEITPIPQTSGRAFFVVFLTRRSLFREDNFEIVELIARYAAQVFDLRYLLARERRLSEDLEIAMVQADAANRAKTDFLANMSHELRTPLNSIIGFSEILAGASFGPLNAKQAKYVDNILGSGRHLLSLINDILDLSKIEAGKMVLTATSFDLLPSVNEVVATVEPLATKKTITLNVAAETEIPPIYADSGKIRQVLYNLLSNAIKFTLPGGEVRVVMRHWGDAQENGDVATVPVVEIRVRDSGIGIKKSDIHRVFGKFEQLDSSYARKQEGTGLGLALTRRLIEMHGGTVTVASEGEGKGSEFTVRLPVRPTRTEAETAHTLELLSRINADNGEKPLVLVIEDDPRAQELITYYLDRAGFAYEITSDAGQALDIAATRKPVAITLDILLPDTNGWEVLRQLKSRAETSPIPVFVISVTHDRELGLSLGAREFFVKPISGRELVDGIHEAMKERASITIPPTGEHEVPNT